MIEKRVYPGAPSVITESSLGASDSDIPDQSKSIFCVFFESSFYCRLRAADREGHLHRTQRTALRLRGFRTAEQGTRASKLQVIVVRMPPDAHGFGILPK